MPTKIYTDVLVGFNLSSLFINLDNLTVQMMHNIHNKTTIIAAHLKIIYYANGGEARVERDW